MKIFNTLTRTKEEFVPQTPGEYRIYVCGPTVYNYIHIGNARPLIVFDTLRRYLEYRGNKVLYVSNITDIDDKLIKKGQEEGTSMQEVARRFEAEYKKDAAGLNALPPTVQPRATEHIDQILDIVADIIDKGYGYVARNGDVYFRARKFKEYGKLSHLNLEDLESGNRELRSQMDDDLKEDPADFAIWKAAKPGEPAWPSPYGPGRPGWHIECSAMARTHLGKTIDLHCGGQDLIFPHHENEIAQSECANGCEFSRYWMHNGFLNIDNRKMSKSAGNFFTVREIADKYGYEPIRYFMLSAGYRMPLNYTVELIESCKSSLERLYTCRDNLDFAIKNAPAEGEETLKEKAAAVREKFDTAMDDDLNTPDALAALFDFVRQINTLAPAASKGALEEAAKAFDELTGVLGLLYNRKKEDEVPAEVTALVEQRAAAKKAKDWATADALRAQITALGWVVEDTPQGPKVTRA
ncbi:cysteine--tRNA ligase [Gemmiger sp. An120]|uniref:cysteine--tRNA ligase n=1 Tax=Gemmiger TaxID=204475 RepID=UPI000B38EC7C|nr:cysteine--tRNA ligase [Gemmiger sp. An120]MBM6914559.1 cysteine--tRNA ligase [Gemmiger formicilis]OUQ42651.1 cysteine--tRNA ligase [Gemmiger sp. An120]